jgi:hypothetical protein
MADRMRVPIFNPDGTVSQKTGTLVQVNRANEPWSEYILEDGTKLRMKQTIVNVVKLDDTNDSGDPVYSIQSQQTLSVIPQIKE